MQSRTFTLSQTTIHAITAGQGTPVLFMHGITANAHVFEPILADLSRDFLVVSIDQRGHGRSGRPAGYRGLDFATDIAELVAQLGQGPALLVGHSLGARNAYVAANHHPEQVLGVVGIDFTPYIEAEVLEQLEARVNGGDRAFASLDDVRAYLAGRYPLMPADAVARRAEHGYRLAVDGYRPLADGAAMQATAAGLKEDLVEELRALRRPTVLVRGKDSKLVSEAAWHKTLLLRPDLPAVEVQAADHYVPEEQPAEISRIIRAHAERIGAGPVTND